MQAIQMASVDINLVLKHAKQTNYTHSIEGSPRTLQPQNNQIILQQMASQNCHQGFTRHNTSQYLNPKTIMLISTN